MKMEESNETHHTSIFLFSHVEGFGFHFTRWFAASQQAATVLVPDVTKL